MADVQVVRVEREIIDALVEVRLVHERQHGGATGVFARDQVGAATEVGATRLDGGEVGRAVGVVWVGRGRLVVVVQ